jgi:DNA polymerase-3 subunit delta
MSTLPKTTVTILAGENWLAIKQELNKQLEAFIKKYGDLGVEKIDAAEKEIDAVTQSIETAPFLAPKKLCIISNLSANKELADKIEQILSFDAEHTEVILVEGKLDKRSAYYKAIKKHAGFKEFNQLDEQETLNWLVGEAKRLGGSLSRSDAQYIYSRVGGNQSRLSGELKKLVDYDESISKNSINELTEPTPSSTVFDLLNAAFSGNKKLTLRLYSDQRLQKVEPQKIIAMIGWQMHLIALVESAKDVTPEDLAKQASANPFVIRKTGSIANKLDRPWIRKILTDLAETDQMLKTTSVDPDDAVKNLLLSLSR